MAPSPRKSAPPLETPSGWSISETAHLKGRDVKYGDELTVRIIDRPRRVRFRRQVTNAAGRVWLDVSLNGVVRSIRPDDVRTVHRIVRMARRD